MSFRAAAVAACSHGFFPDRCGRLRIKSSQCWQETGGLHADHARSSSLFMIFFIRARRQRAVLELSRRPPAITVGCSLRNCAMVQKIVLHTIVASFRPLRNVNRLILHLLRVVSIDLADLAFSLAIVSLLAVGKICACSDRRAAT
jgi:hypothetical protein